MHVRRRLDGLDGADRLFGLDFQVGFGELNVDDVSERVGGVLGDADFSWIFRFGSAHSIPHNKDIKLLDHIDDGLICGIELNHLPVLPPSASSTHSCEPVYFFSWAVP